MVEINWSFQSIDDINSIAEYVAKDSKKYAALQTERIFSRVAILEKSPLSGRIVPELNISKFREVILGNYRIIYKIVSKKRIDILTVHHSARLLPKDRFR